MSSWRDKLERIAEAIMFGERGEGDHARESGRRGRSDQPGGKGILGKMERIMMAVTFAEANCHEEARAFLEPSTESRKERAIRVAAAPSFTELVGLKGARVWYGVAEIS